MSTKRACPLCSREFQEDELVRPQTGSSDEKIYEIPEHKWDDPKKGWARCEGSGIVVWITSSGRRLH